MYIYVCCVICYVCQIVTCVCVFMLLFNFVLFMLAPSLCNSASLPPFMLALVIVPSALVQVVLQDAHCLLQDIPQGLR